MRNAIPYGRWLLLDRIAIGGTAEVFVATLRGHPAGRLYAVKRLLPTLAEDPELVALFHGEARLVAQLAHPAIPLVREVGSHGDGHYIAMDYVAGKDLRALLDRARAGGERLPIPLAAWIAARVADALDHAHRRRDAGGAELRLVHRDLSPTNVLLGFDGAVRVIDFGIAQAALPARRAQIVPRGKGGYASPEMAQGLQVDRRSDVYSLGAVLHEMLTGQPLFARAGRPAIPARARGAEPSAPSALRGDIPPALDALVLRALAPLPEERFAWASELRDALAPFSPAGTGASPALAQLLARTFPAELQAELGRTP